MKAYIGKVSLLLSLVFAFAFMAMAQETTGGIQGTIKDPQGAVVPGASITVTGVSVGFNRTVSADDSGFFRIQELPPGEYRVAITATGFQMAPQTARVAVGKVSNLDLQLNVAGSTATVNVTGGDNQVVVDTTDSTVQSNVSEQLIDQVPKGVSFDSLLRLDPATRAEPLSGGFQVDGASGSENNFMINGQEVNNFRHGTLNDANAVPNQVVSEVQIKTSGFEAEFGGASGAVVSVVTKSGTNAWRGEFGAQFVTSKLNAGNRPSLYEYRGTTFTPAGSTTPNTTYTGVPYLYGYRNPSDAYNSFFPTANLGGAIIKDRAWFFASYSPQIFERSRTINFYNPVVTGNAFSLTPTTLGEVYNTKTKYEYALARVDAQIADSLRFMGSFLWNPQIIDGGLPCTSFCIGSRPNAVFNGQTYAGAAASGLEGGRVNSNNTTLQLVWSPTSKFFMNGRYGHNFLNDKPASYGVFGQTSYLCSATNSTPTAFASGCTPSFRNIPSAANFLSERNVSRRDTWNIDASYLANFAGRHQFKGGYERGQVKSDVRESYIGGLITLYYGRPISQLTGQTPTTGNFGSGILTEYGEDAQGSNSWDTLYVQDNWTPFNRLTLNLGLRAEREDLPAFNTASGQAGQAFQFGFGDKLMPRLGFALDVFGNGKTKVFGSYGLFMDRLRFELPIGSFGGAYYRQSYFELLGSGQAYTSFTIPRIIGNYPQPVGGGTNDNTSGTLVRYQLDYRIPSNLSEATYEALGVPRGGIDPDLKPFTQRELTVGMEHQIKQNLVFRFRYSNKTVLHAIEDMANLSNDFGESYIIGNPGEGLALQLRNSEGYARQAEVKAVREYNGAEFVLDKGLSNNYFFNVSYTLSKLFGNYSGLASSDEKGRSDPGVNRFFDYAVNGFTGTGALDLGRLPTDRPHVLKSYGGYVFDWFGRRNHSTTLSYFTTVQSGTPLTTFFDVESSFIPLTKRGDLGRTKTFSQTDLNLSHRYRFGRDSRFTMAFDVNVTNLFNQATVLSLNDRINLPGYATGLHCGTGAIPEDAVPCLNYIINNGVTAEVNNLLSTTPTSRTALYQQPLSYQPNRSIRFGMRLFF